MTENQPISVSAMLRTTAANTADFMHNIADHIEKLEATILDLQTQLQDAKKE